MKTHCLRLAASLLLVVSSTSFAADAADVDQLRTTTMRLIDLLVEQGVLTRAKADALLKEAQRPVAATAAPAAAAPAASGVVRVPYVPEHVRKELKDEVRSELAAQAAAEGWTAPNTVPEWTRRIVIDGDLRVRAQADRYDDANAPAISVNETNRNRAYTLANSTEDRDRLRVRARLGATATLDENWSAGLRITTGSTTDPISSNQTLGNYNNRATVVFDRAYIRYLWRDQLNVVGGRFGNPWLGTDLVWANDLSFDGVAAQWTPRLSPSMRGFLTLAAMPVQEVEIGGDKWLFGAQIGAGSVATARSVGNKFGLGYYHYKGIVGQTSPPGLATNEYTAPAFSQKGNSYYNISSRNDSGGQNMPLLGLASDYRLVNLTGSLDFPVGGKHLLLTGDFVRNVGFDQAVVSARMGRDVSPMVDAYLARAVFGSAEVKLGGDWQTFFGYKRIERDSVLDAFNDSDFHLGGTDARGFFLGGIYGLGKNNSVGLRLFSAEAISGPPLAIDVWQLDFNLRF